MVKIYTRTGDDGGTSLFGGERVAKHHARLDAYGTVDELNAVLGWVLARNTHGDIAACLSRVQAELFDLGAHLATPPTATKARSILPKLPETRITALEQTIDTLDAELEPLTAFILPGGTEESAVLHVARTVCRRAERAVSALGASPQDLDPHILVYLNRLSDLLFVMARVVNKRAGKTEPTWKP